MKSGISIVLGSYNRLNFLTLAIDSVRKECLLHSLSHEIIVVDGGSTDGSLEWLISQKDIITIIQHNRGEWRGKPVTRRSWGYFMNLGFKAAQGTYICMISDDSVLVPGALINGYTLFEDERNKGRKIGALAFYWRHWPSDKAYHVGTPMGHKMYVNHGMYLKEALEAVGYIDEVAYRFYFADIDLCMRLWQAGYECIDSPQSFVEHYECANTAVRSSNEDNMTADGQTFTARWSKVYSDLTGASIGQVRTRLFVDSYATAKVFRAPHVKDLVKQPALIKGWIKLPPRILTIKAGVRAWVKKCLYGISGR